MEIRNGTYCVYVHTNKINGKMYVGQTIYGDRPHKRWDNGNGYVGSSYFYNAIQKYGWDNFEHEIIANNLTADEADNFERLLILKLDLQNPNKGYNLESGGTKNKTLSESTKKKISESRMCKSNGPHSDETKKRISESNKGRVLSDITKRKISAIRKECWENEEYRQSQIEKHKWQTGENHPWYGKQHSEESKEKMKQSHTKSHVWCIELNELFYNSEEVKRKLGIDASDVRKACKDPRKSAGKHPITGEKLHWKFIDKEVARDEGFIM